MLDKMKPMIAEQLNVDESEIKAESNFKEDLGADSLDLFELVMALEEEFGVEIPSEDLEKIATVADVMDYLLITENIISHFAGMYGVGRRVSSWSRRIQCRGTWYHRCSKCTA